MSGDLPDELRPFLALAERWGEADDGYRSDALAAASDEDLASLVDAMDQAGAEVLYAWLAGPAADDDEPSEDYVRLSALSMAVDEAELILSRRGGEG